MARQVHNAMPTGDIMKGHPFYAAVYDRMSRGTEAGLLSPLRRRLLKDLSGLVLDIGAGTGANLPFYRANATVFALEPDPYMRMRGEKRPSPAKVAWVEASAEAIPFPDNHFDTVVATLVLCTVADPVRALAEVRRVLRPGGRLIFLEHVASHSPISRLTQTAINPLWRQLTAGCNLTRDSLSTIGAAGFEIVWHETKPLPLQVLVWGEGILPL